MYLIAPISNEPFFFQWDLYYILLNLLSYLPPIRRHTGLLPVGDEEELFWRENTLLLAPPPPQLSHMAPAGISRNKNMFSAEKCPTAAGSLGLEQGLRGRAPLPRSPTARSCRLQKSVQLLQPNLLTV